jgi:hypothetical protein
MVTSRIAALFDELPMLCGFTVSRDLQDVQIVVHTWPGWSPGREFTDEIRAVVEDLIANGPQEAAELLRGRTFARAIH